MTAAARGFLGVVKRALLGGGLAWLATIGLLVYALGILVVNRVRHTYWSTRPLALEDVRGRELSFDAVLEVSDAQVDGVLGHGWYALEGGGIRWSAGLSSVLALPAQDVEADLTLVLRLVAVGDGENSHNRIRVVCNAHELGVLDVKVNSSDDYSIHLPASVHQGYPAIVTLNYSFAVQPSGTDQREIAVRLMALTLKQGAARKM